MLHSETVHPETFRVLNQLLKQDYLKNYRLVGGTALALQIGHRISEDLDFFSGMESDVTQIVGNIEAMGKIEIVNHTTRVLNCYIDDIKVDFVAYQYDFIEKPVVEDTIRMASIKDIAAMKLSAITGRGARKDFVDLYFLLQRYTFAELLNFYKAKYPDGSTFLVYKSVVYFVDAETAPMPKMLIPETWTTMKNTIKQAVEAYLS